MINAAVLASGDGLEIQSLLDSIFFNEISDFKLGAVISSTPDSYALIRAKNSGIPTYIVNEAMFPNGAIFSTALNNKLLDLDIDLVVLAGFSTSVGPSVINTFGGRIIGIRNALCPAFDNVPEAKLCEEALAKGVKVSGSTTYILSGHGGIGRILSQKPVEVLSGDTPESLRRRIVEEVGGALLTETIRLCCCGVAK